MAELIEELDRLPRAEQEFILGYLMHDYSPISVDGTVYMIPLKVNELIENLFTEVQDLRHGKEINQE